MSLDDVSVRFRVPMEPIRTFKEYAIRILQRRVRYQEFFALSEINLQIEQGEAFGIFGRNGAGKSTLLKVTSRVLRPTHGRVRVVGRMAPLLELGAGFHPELTGRENVYLNGTLLGFTQAEIALLFQEILEFSELNEFIDAPLRTYSSGMVVRLGFAVATAVRPDIMLVDEILSVGDERFKKKCLARMEEFRNRGTTILLVTHNSNLALSTCSRGVWLDHGKIRAQGPIEETIRQYRESA